MIKDSKSIFAFDSIGVYVVGALLISLYSLYGAYVESQYILYGQKGSLRSAEFYLFLLVGVSIVSTPLVKSILTKLFYSWHAALLFAFLSYFCFALLISDVFTKQYYLSILISEIGFGIVSGILMFMPWKSPFRVLSKPIGLLDKFNPTVLIFALLLVWFALFVFQMQSLSISFFAEISSSWRYKNNIYYQGFGDSIAVGLCCIVAIQAYIYTSSRKMSYPFFVVIMFLEIGLTFLGLQIVGSNKASLIVALIGAMSVLVAIPPRRDLGKTKFWMTVLLVVFFGAALIALAQPLWSNFDVEALRFWNSNEGGGSILKNRSLSTRIAKIDGEVLKQIGDAPIFGDLSIVNYIHSSLISVLTHLGIVGFVLLWGFIGIKLVSVYRSPGNIRLKIVFIPILFVSIISSAFYWFPFWFLMGGLLFDERSR